MLHSQNITQGKNVLLLISAQPFQKALYKLEGSR